MAEPIATYSIVACDPISGALGIGVQSRFLAVGALVPHAEAGVGAVVTQSFAHPRHGAAALGLLREGLAPGEALDRLLDGDPSGDVRQLGAVDALGRSAAFTGEACVAAAAHRTGEGYTAQGNMLASTEVVNALAETFEATAAKPLAERLLHALDAAEAAGGDFRGQQAAALLVVEAEAGYAGLSDVVVDLRVDDHERPLAELRRLYGLHEAYYGVHPREQWLPLHDGLAEEVRDRLGRFGYDGGLEQALDRWAREARLAERVDGADAIDPVALLVLRSASR